MLSNLDVMKMEIMYKFHIVANDHMCRCKKGGNQLYITFV